MVAEADFPLLRRQRRVELLLRVCARQDGHHASYRLGLTEAMSPGWGGGVFFRCSFIRLFFSALFFPVLFTPDFANLRFGAFPPFLFVHVQLLRLAYPDATNIEAGAGASAV